MTMVWFHLQNGQRVREKKGEGESEGREGGEENKSRASYTVVIHRRPVQAAISKCSASQHGLRLRGPVE